MVKFLQSMSDFPLTVSFGEKTPAWGLNRWEGRGLRFIPLDDESFSLRGNRQRLFYKGQRRSHRFTILGDGGFEYDCILKKEPESNVITLLLDGAEYFDFFKQPDFITDPFLKGSYAVYKKETLLGEGTGKMCHIHRPEIIDARGRRCWGDLSVAGNELRITIPENWLSEAKYPIVVDPTIGTTTVGSQYLWYADPPEPWAPLMYEGAIPVNRFLVSENINGLCTAYFYTNDDEDEAGGRPVIYSDNGNVPQTRMSMEEGFADFSVNGSNPKGWRSATFKSNGTISSGSYIWFGCFADFFWFPRFDYGAKIYGDDWWSKGSGIPNTYPLYNANWYGDFKLSMYFDYSSAQSYIRILTQGVSLLDNSKHTAEYKRNMAEAVQTLDYNTYSFLVFRSLQETVTVTETMKHLGAFFRGLFDHAKIESKVKPGRFYFLTLTDTVQAVGVVFRGLLLFVRIATGLFVKDYILRRFLIAKEELVLKSCITREIILESKIA